MRLLTTIVAVICASLVAHAAHLAPWDSCGGGVIAVGTGAETVCAYDVRSRLARRTTADGMDAFSYDLAGNLLAASNSVAVKTGMSSTAVENFSEMYMSIYLEEKTKGEV